jgi:hypothetical protein
MKLKKRSVVFLIVIIFPLLFIGWIYKIDRIDRHRFPTSKVGISNWGEAFEHTRGLSSLVNLISSCKRFPDNYEDAFRKTDSSNCNPLENKSKDNPLAYDTEFPDYQPWIDPWGRPYQIHYDLERGKLQVRSQGRYLWTEFDDIVGETPFLTKDYPKDGLPLYVEMLEHCKKVPKDDLSCVFNRGWH